MLLKALPLPLADIQPERDIPVGKELLYRVDFFREGEAKVSFGVLPAIKEPATFLTLLDNAIKTGDRKAGYQDLCDYLKFHNALCGLEALAEGELSLMGQILENTGETKKPGEDAAAENAYFDEKYTKRVGENCRILAQSLQFSPLFEDRISDSFVETIEIAAPLCDIGNIAIPREILQKMSDLTEEEAAVARRHPIMGAKLLRDIYTDKDYNGFMKMAIDIAGCHHENWNGSGYPEGISGEDIPIAARIASLVIVYCALTEKRPYRPPLSMDEALAVMGKDSGKKYDPDIFRIYCKIYRQLC